MAKRNNGLEMQLSNEQRDARKKHARQAQELPQYHNKVKRHRHLAMLINKKLQPQTDDVAPPERPQLHSLNGSQQVNNSWSPGHSVQWSQRFTECDYDTLPVDEEQYNTSRVQSQSRTSITSSPQYTTIQSVDEPQNIPQSPESTDQHWQLSPYFAQVQDLDSNRPQTPPSDGQM